MEHPENKARRSPRLRSKQEIMNLLGEYEVSRHHTSLVKFCKDHQVPTGTFYTWQRYQREGKYSDKGKFIEIPLDSVPVVKENAGVVFASLSSGELTIQLHQYVEPGYIKALLGKQKGS